MFKLMQCSLIYFNFVVNYKDHHLTIYSYTIGNKPATKIPKSITVRCITYKLAWNKFI